MNKHIETTGVAVVGGGLAGLAAATYLARAGIDITVFEKAAAPGGRAASQDKAGFIFNLGIHALYTGGAASQVLGELGIAYSGRSPSTIMALRRGRLYAAPVGMLSMLRTDLLSFADKLELMGLFASLPKLNAPDLRDMSVQEWLDRSVRRPRVRELMAANARTFVYSSALDLVSAEVFMTKMQLSLNNPVEYIDGGWQHIVDELRSHAEQAGAHILTGARVDAVEHQAGRVTGVRLSDGHLVGAGAVIVAAKPQDALKLVDHGEYQPLRRIVGSLTPALVACLDVALSRLPDMRNGVVQDLDGPRFMSTQSLYSNVAPESGALIYTFKQLDPRRETSPADDERDLEALLDAAQPGWRDVLVKRQFLPRIEAIGMLPMASGGGYSGRPSPQVPGIENLLVAGDWVGAGFLSDATLGSARDAARMLIRNGVKPPSMQ